MTVVKPGHFCCTICFTLCCKLCFKLRAERDVLVVAICVLRDGIVDVDIRARQAGLYELIACSLWERPTALNWAMR